MATTPPPPCARRSRERPLLSRKPETVEDLTDPTLWWAAVVFQRARLRRISVKDPHEAPDLSPLWTILDDPGGARKRLVSAAGRPCLTSGSSARVGHDDHVGSLVPRINRRRVGVTCQTPHVLTDSRRRRLLPSELAGRRNARRCP